MTPEELTRMREMVRALNQMLRERAEGGEPDFDSFMQQYGDYFPGVNSLDDLVEQMQRQQMAMQAVMDSMSAEQREQLQRHDRPVDRRRPAARGSGRVGDEPGDGRAVGRQHARIG